MKAPVLPGGRGKPIAFECKQLELAESTIKVTTVSNWPMYQKFLTHLTDFLKVNVLLWVKMAHLPGMFIYPAVHLCGV